MASPVVAVRDITGADSRVTAGVLEAVGLPFMGGGMSTAEAGADLATVTAAGMAGLGLGAGGVLVGAFAAG